MSSMVIVFLLLVAFFLSIFQSKKSQIIICLLTLVVFFLIGDGFLPGVFLKNLQIYPPQDNPQWEKRNAIVLLGAGAVRIPQYNEVKPTLFAYSRIQETASLYFSCKKTQFICTVIISGGDALATGRSEADVYREQLLGLGIKAADIEIEPASMNTFKNAEYTSAILQKGHFDRIFMVTSGIHEKRALLYFANFGMNAIPAPSDYIAAVNSFIPLGYNFAITDSAIHEYLGILRFHLYNFFGWNKNVSYQGAL